MTGRRAYFTDFLVPLGTPQATPLTLQVPLEDANLDQVVIVVPSGHNGFTGLAITWNGAPFYPLNPGGFLVASGEIITHPYDGEITAGGMVLTGFNTDMFDHSFHLRWQISDLPASASPVVIASPQLVPAAAADIAAVQQLAVSADDGSGDLSAAQLIGAGT